MYIVCGALIIYYSYKAKAELLLKVQNESALPKEKIQWILNLLLILRAFSIFFISITLIDLVFFNYAFDSFYRIPLFLGLAIITYGIGLVGFSKRDTILIKPSKVDKITLLGLAYEAGFNSKASFNRSVKKITGKSPKALKSKE